MFDRGFTGFKKSKPLEEVNVGDISNGIYVFGKKDIHLKDCELDNYIFVGIDPGRNKPVSACQIDGANIPVDWNDEKRIDVLDKSISQNVFISNDEYRLLTGSKQQEEYEKCRRIGKYQKALSSFADTVCKSGILSVTSSYYKVRLRTWNVIRKEIFHRARTCYKFISFKKRQKALAYFAKGIIADAKRKAFEENKKLIVFFGNGSFSPGGSGYASVPRKPFIKELGIQCPTIITNEFRTSKISPISFQLLKNNKKTKSLNGDRLRQCITDPEAPDAPMV